MSSLSVQEEQYGLCQAILSVCHSELSRGAHGLLHRKLVLLFQNTEIPHHDQISGIITYPGCTFIAKAQKLVALSLCRFKILFLAVWCMIAFRFHFSLLQKYSKWLLAALLNMLIDYAK